MFIQENTIFKGVLKVRNLALPFRLEYLEMKQIGESFSLSKLKRKKESISSG